MVTNNSQRYGISNKKDLLSKLYFLMNDNVVLLNQPTQFNVKACFVVIDCLLPNKLYIISWDGSTNLHVPMYFKRNVCKQSPEHTIQLSCMHLTTNDSPNPNLKQHRPFPKNYLMPSLNFVSIEETQRSTAELFLLLQGQSYKHINRQYKHKIYSRCINVVRCMGQSTLVKYKHTKQFIDA